MSFYLRLRDAMDGKVKSLDELPRGYQIIGKP
jgi:hypothetical protein